MLYVMGNARLDRTMAQTTLHDTIRMIDEVSAGVESQNRLTGHMMSGIDWLTQMFQRRMHKKIGRNNETERVFSDLSTISE